MWRLKYEAAGDEAAAAGDAAVDAAAVRPPSKKRPRQAAAAAAEGGDSSESDDSDSRDLFAVSKGKGRRGSVRKRHANGSVRKRKRQLWGVNERVQDEVVYKFWLLVCSEFRVLYAFQRVVRTQSVVCMSRT